MSEDLIFFKCTEKELPLVASLAHEIWNEHYPNIIGQNQVDYMLGNLYNLNSLKKQLNDGQLFYLIFEKNENLGFFSISKLSDKNLFLNKLYIKNRRNGIGKKTLNWIVENYPPERIELTVNRQNFEAINFYFKNGFTIKKVADFDIGQGYFMNDFIMVKII